MPDSLDSEERLATWFQVDVPVPAETLIEGRDRDHFSGERSKEASFPRGIIDYDFRWTPELDRRLEGQRLATWFQVDVPVPAEASVEGGHGVARQQHRRVPCSWIYCVYACTGQRGFTPTALTTVGRRACMRLLRDTPGPGAPESRQRGNLGGSRCLARVATAASPCPLPRAQISSGRGFEISTRAQ